MLLVISKGIYW